MVSRKLLICRGEWRSDVSKHWDPASENTGVGQGLPLHSSKLSRQSVPSCVADLTLCKHCDGLARCSRDLCVCKPYAALSLQV